MKKERTPIDARAVVGTNAWGGALYGKLLRGSYVEEDEIRDIPDINGNAYYADVTENNFLLSDESRRT